MIVYLRSWHLSDYWIGEARGVGSLYGFIGATVFPAMHAKYGLFQSGMFSIWYQFAMVGTAASVFFWLSGASVMFVVLVCTVSISVLSVCTAVCAAVQGLIELVNQCDNQYYSFSTANSG